MQAAMFSFLVFCLSAGTLANVSSCDDHSRKSIPESGSVSQLDTNDDRSIESVDAAQPPPTAAALLAPPLGPTECFTCSNCADVTASTPRRPCPITNALDMAGKCIVYAEKFNMMGKLWWVRGCPQELGSCRDVLAAHAVGGGGAGGQVTLAYCRECAGDLCNAAPAQAVGAARVLLAAILLAFMT